MDVPAGRSLPLVLAGVVEVIMERERENERARERGGGGERAWEVLV